MDLSRRVIVSGNHQQTVNFGLDRETYQRFQLSSTLAVFGDGRFHPIGTPWTDHAGGFVAPITGVGTQLPQAPVVFRRCGRRSDVPTLTTGAFGAVFLEQLLACATKPKAAAVQQQVQGLAVPRRSWAWRLQRLGPLVGYKLTLYGRSAWECGASGAGRR